MTSLSMFLKKSDQSALAEVMITTGGDRPFCKLTLRSFHPERDERSLDIVDRTFGIRALNLSQETAWLGDPNNRKETHQPVLLRLNPRAREGKPEEIRPSRFIMWNPVGPDDIKVSIEETFDARDLLVIAERPIGKLNLSAIDIPAMRLVEGECKARLYLKKNHRLTKILKIDLQAGTMLDELTI